MLEVSPNWLQWHLITSAGPLSLIALLAALGLFLWFAYLYSHEKVEGLYKFGFLGLLALLVSVALPLVSEIPRQSLSSSIVGEISSKAKMQDVKLLHVETVAGTPISEGSIGFVGIATNSDGESIQFSYTQYQDFGVYSPIGFASQDEVSETRLDRGLKLHGGS